MTGTVEYIVTITIKDGKYRVKTENPMATWQESFMVLGRILAGNGLT